MENIVEVKDTETINEPQVNETVQQPQVNEKVEIADWTKDKNFESVWKKDPNNLYKSYNESQKQWHEFYQPLSGVLKEYKIKNAEELKKYFEGRKDYDTLKANEDNFMNIWNHPQYGTKLQQLFNEIQSEQQKLETDPTYQSQKRLEQLEARLAEYEKKESYKQGEIKLNSSLDEVQGLVKQYGLKDFKETEFIQELMEKDVKLEGIKSYFIERFLPEIIKAEKSRAENGVVKNLKNNSKGSIVSDSKVSNKKEELNWDNAMDALLNK